MIATRDGIEVANIGQKEFDTQLPIILYYAHNIIIQCLIFAIF